MGPPPNVTDCDSPIGKCLSTVECEATSGHVIDGLACSECVCCVHVLPRGSDEEDIDPRSREDGPCREGGPSREYAPSMEDGPGIEDGPSREAGPGMEDVLFFFRFLIIITAKNVAFTHKQTSYIRTPKIQTKIAISRLVHTHHS